MIRIVDEKERRRERLEQKQKFKNQEYSCDDEYGLTINDICSQEYTACMNNVKRILLHFEKTYGKKHPKEKEMLQKCRDDYAGCIDSIGIRRGMYKEIT